MRPVPVAPRIPPQRKQRPGKPTPIRNPKLFNSHDLSPGPSIPSPPFPYIRAPSSTSRANPATPSTADSPAPTLPHATHAETDASRLALPPSPALNKTSHYSPPAPSCRRSSQTKTSVAYPSSPASPPIRNPPDSDQAHLPTNISVTRDANPAHET